ncbi:MAG: glycosyltransferase family 2 protein [Clostridium sp.]|nr:glycosyltransferase family 2 protein [Clostridium sp.]
MNKISCIVLNYNDAHTTCGLVEELLGINCLDFVVVVDNCSTDDSWETLSALGDGGGRLSLIRAEQNGGYGWGNQIGVDWAVDRLGADYVMVANPDIHVTESCILRVKEVLDQTERCGLASALVESPQGKPLLSYWTLLPLWKDLLDTGLITRRLFARRLNVPQERLKQGGLSGCRLVDAVPGSFFMLRADRFPAGEIHKVFDKKIFLYYEEKVLGRKLRAMGLTAALALDCSYVHAHSVSIDKSVKKIGDKQRLLHESKLYYYREYLHAGPLKMAGARAFLGLVLAEVRFLTEVCGMRW